VALFAIPKNFAARLTVNLNGFVAIPNFFAARLTVNLNGQFHRCTADRQFE
jgi:hypothetical protein